VVVRVIDRGPGIAGDLCGRVFDHFVRGTADGDGAGTGLGLAIVRGLVEAQSGHVWVDEPDGGVGTCMAISLPAAPADGEDDR
jgi:two-component system, OmpR family, sensor histidine kinase KdpD